jgi:hypothetical protein
VECHSFEFLARYHDNIKQNLIVAHPYNDSAPCYNSEHTIIQYIIKS